MRTARTIVRSRGITDRSFVTGFRFPWFLNHLGLIAWLIATVTVAPLDASAAKQKTPRKESPKTKTTPAPPPAQKLTKTQTRNALMRQPIEAPIDPLEKWDHTVYRTGSRETVSDLLARYGLTRSEKQFWVSSIKRNLGSEVIPAGKQVHLYFSKPTWQNRGQSRPGLLKAVEVDQNDAYTATFERGIRGILFQKREKPYDVELKTVSGSVASSLFEDGRRAGIQPALLSQLADIFTWDIDLEKDIHPGDSYKILYEQRTRKGQETKPSFRIMAAELLSAGQKFTAIYFEKQKGQGNYYNTEGQSLARSFLRFPLEFSSITSLFTESRFHPILKTNLPHTGVDFAAQRGTPVRAVGDGVIAEAGWNGAYGKAIDVKHDTTYMSRYAHLDRFAEGIHAGVTVTKGQVIGYVGSTGRSTGPHLHFELYKDQQYINPLSVDFPAEESIEPAFQRVFENQKRTFLVELTSTPQS